MLHQMKLGNNNKLGIHGEMGHWKDDGLQEIVNESTILANHKWSLVIKCKS